ncbi:MAG: hypothetical protein ACFFCM_06105 [Promethearchaeota archaeon]
MEAISKLKVFGLTTNQANLLKFFIESYQKENINEQNLTFKKIREKFGSKKSFYRELIRDLTKLEFLKVINKKKPFVYQYNESRMFDLIQEEQNSYLSQQKDFEKLIKEFKDLINQNPSLKQISEFLRKSQHYLRLSDEVILILKAFFSQENGRIIKNSRTTKQFIEIIGENNIRYNLNLLLNRGFISRKRIGREYSYEPKDFLVILKTEKEVQKKKWVNKKKLMREAIQYFDKKPIITNEEVQKFKGPDKLLEYLKLATNEILIIHPFYTGKRDMINKRVQKIIEKILDFINLSKVKINCLIAGKVEHLNLENIKELLRSIPQIEVRVTSRLLTNVTIVIDSKYTIHSFESNLDFILIQDDQTADLHKNEFYESWKLAEDFRIQISRNDELNQQIKQELEESLNLYPIVSETKLNYEIFPLGDELITKLKYLLESANQEIILDFRGHIERVKEVQIYFQEFFKNLIVLLRKKNIKVKLLFGVNSWLVNKLDQTFIQLIQ